MLDHSHHPRMIGTNSLPIQSDCAAPCHDSLKQNMASVLPFSRCHSVWGKRFCPEPWFGGSNLIFWAPKSREGTKGTMWPKRKPEFLFSKHVWKGRVVRVRQIVFLVGLLSSCRFSGGCTSVLIDLNS